MKLKRMKDAGDEGIHSKAVVKEVTQSDAGDAIDDEKHDDWEDEKGTLTESGKFLGETHDCLRQKQRHDRDDWESKEEMMSQMKQEMKTMHPTLTAVGSADKAIDVQQMQPDVYVVSSSSESTSWFFLPLTLQLLP